MEVDAEGEEVLRSIARDEAKHFKNRTIATKKKEERKNFGQQRGHFIKAHKEWSTKKRKIEREEEENFKEGAQALHGVLCR